MIEYKGYRAQVIFDEESEVLHGEVLGIRDVVTFQAQSVPELQKAFQDSVDDYLEFCRQRGEEPDRAFSGRFVARVAPALHRRMTELARRSGMSLNAWIEQYLQAAVSEDQAGKNASRRDSARKIEGKKTRRRKVRAS